MHERHADLFHAGDLPPPAELGDGITVLPLPLNGSALRSVMVYTIATSAGIVMVDAGYRHPTCWDAAVAGMVSAGQRIDDVVAVLLTHNHPDHVGFADSVREASGAEVVMHVRDDFATQRHERGGFLEQLSAVLASTGAPAEVVTEMYDAAVGVAVHHESLELDRVLTTATTDLVFGDTTIRAVHTPGHTYGHTAYLHLGARALFTGDTLMPEGPTQLALAPLAGDDPAGDLLASLRRIADLDPAMGCAAHQYPYADVARRALALHDHHAREVDEVARLASTYDTAWEIAPHLTWAKPWAAMGPGTKRFSLVHTHALLRAVRA
ncbi:MAG: MBL fold metallo-hydrolase [Nocardioides sp.]|nr:MBL fold metallo-hydrolase [Nocardioides sp.]